MKILKGGAAHWAKAQLRLRSVPSTFFSIHWSIFFCISGEKWFFQSPILPAKLILPDIYGNTMKTQEILCLWDNGRVLALLSRYSPLRKNLTSLSSFFSNTLSFMGSPLAFMAEKEVCLATWRRDRIHCTTSCTKHKNFVHILLWTLKQHAWHTRSCQTLTASSFSWLSRVPKNSLSFPNSSMMSAFMSS